MIFKNARQFISAIPQERCLVIFDLFEFSRYFLHIFNPFRKKSFAISPKNPWPAFLCNNLGAKKKS